MTTLEYVQGLRLLADWYEAHPETELPYEAERVAYIFVEKTGLQALLGAFGGHWTKTARDGLFYATRMFGPLTLTALIAQSAVCTARVVGTKVLPAMPERTIDVLEWDCAPILETEVMP